MFTFHQEKVAVASLCIGTINKFTTEVLKAITAPKVSVLIPSRVRHICIEKFSNIFTDTLHTAFALQKKA